MLTTLEKLSLSIVTAAVAVGYFVLGVSGYAMAHGEPLRGSFQSGCRLLGLM